MHLRLIELNSSVTLLFTLKKAFCACSNKNKFTWFTELPYLLLRVSYKWRRHRRCTSTAAAAEMFRYLSKWEEKAFVSTSRYSRSSINTVEFSWIATFVGSDVFVYVLSIHNYLCIFVEIWATFFSLLLNCSFYYFCVLKLIYWKTVCAKNI